MQEQSNGTICSNKNANSLLIAVGSASHFNNNSINYNNSNNNDIVNAHENDDDGMNRNNDDHTYNRLNSVNNSSAIGNNLNTPENVQNSTKILPKQIKFYRIGLLLFASLYTFLYGGAFYGWGPMQLMLEQNGSYSIKCSNNDNVINITSSTTTSIQSSDRTNVSNSNNTNSPITICSEQTASLIRIQFVANLAVLFCPILGAIGDRYGIISFVSIIIGLVSIALILLSLSVEYMIDQLLYVSFFLFGIVANIIGILSVETGVHLYPVFSDSKNDDNTNIKNNNNEIYRCRVIATLNALFDAGSITFLGFWAISNTFHISLTYITILYSVIAVICFSGGIYFWIKVLTIPSSRSQSSKPIVTYASGGEAREVFDLDGTNVSTTEGTWNETKQSDDKQDDTLDEIEKCATDNHLLEHNVTIKNNIINSSIDDAKYIKISYRTIIQQLTSEPFIMLCIIFAIQDTTNVYTLTTTRDFLSYLGDDDLGNKYLTIFTFLLPVSILGLPFVDYVLQQYGFYGGFQMINLLSILHGIIKVSTTNLNIQIIGFIIFSIFRCFLFGVSLSFVPTLLSSLVSGKGIGIMFFIQGVFGFINFPLSSFAVVQNNGNFFLSNVIVLLVSLPCFIAGWRINVYIKKDKASIAKVR